MKTCRNGDKGTDVAVMQTILAALWMTDYNGMFITPDGEFGSKTRAAVERFQGAAKKNGLYTGEIDGIFGPKCWRAVGYDT